MPEGFESIPLLIVGVEDNPNNVLASGVTVEYFLVVDGEVPIGLIEWSELNRGSAIGGSAIGVERFRDVAMRAPTHRMLELESAGDSDTETVDNYDFGYLGVQLERGTLRVVAGDWGGTGGVFDPQLPGSPQVPLLYRECTRYQHPNFIPAEYPKMNCVDPTPAVHPLR